MTRVSFPPSNLLPSRKLHTVSGRFETSEKISSINACWVAMSYGKDKHECIVHYEKLNLLFADKTWIVLAFRGY
jgi:hypothetical protein